MLRFLLRLKRRIQRLLKVKSPERQKYVPTKRVRLIRFGLLLAFSLLVVLLYPTEDLYDPFDTPRRGDVAREDIIAPFPITLSKSARELSDERNRMRQAVPLMLAYDSSVVVKALDDLGRFFEVVDSLHESDGSPSQGREDEWFALLTSLYPLLSDATINYSLEGSVSLDSVHRRLVHIYSDDIYRVGFLENLATLPGSRIRSVIILRGDAEMSFPLDRLMDKAVAYGRLLTALNQLAISDSINVNYYYHIAKNFLSPNLRLDALEYEARVAEALSVVGEISERVEEGDIIIRAGQKVFKRHEDILKEMARINRLQALEEWGVGAYLPLLGRIMMVLVLFLILYQFLYYFRRDIFNSNPRLVALLLVFAIQLLLIYLVDSLANMTDIQSIYVYPVAILPILVAILYDAEVSILSTIVLALLLGVMHRFSFLMTFLTVVIGVAAAFSSRTVRKRSDYYRIMLAVVVTYTLFVFSVENLRLAPSAEVLSDLLYGTLMGILSIPLVIFLAPLFESIFGFTTDITLLELSDLNHPLLKRLSLEAPGTYHHSISVGNLSEAAAEAINANALLARVGTYYHDIGKIEIPEYFVENQLSVTSKHESLTPTMSTMILTSHVKKGRMLGEEAGIPDEVLNFIEEHHGTMIMSYFLNKAVEQGEDKSATAKYRYPGPKPQTRETGISMLADAVEAASRTLDDPKPARINTLIQRIINDRYQAGELDECPLTLRDLARIREAFSTVLMAAFHHRVEYPKGDKSAN